MKDEEADFHEFTDQPDDVNIGDEILPYDFGIGRRVPVTEANYGPLPPHARFAQNSRFGNGSRFNSARSRFM